jgi:putative membrane protein
VLVLLARAVISLVANAVALLVADVVLDDVSIGATGFVVAVLVFTGVAVLIEPLIRQMALKNAPAILGSTALVATLVSLIVTTLITDEMSISGAATWVIATVLVWAVALGARLLLPLVIFKRTLAEASDRRG